MCIYIIHLKMLPVVSARKPGGREGRGLYVVFPHSYYHLGKNLETCKVRHLERFYYKIQVHTQSKCRHPQRKSRPLEVWKPISGQANRRSKGRELLKWVRHFPRIDTLPFSLLMWGFQMCCGISYMVGTANSARLMS